MSYKEAILQLDEILGLADFGIGNLRVIQAALAESAIDTNMGGDALFAASEYLRDLHDQMTALVHQAIKHGGDPAPQMEAVA